MASEEKEWATLLAEVFERLTAKHASMTYDFNGLTFESENSGKTEGTVVPTGRVKISGKLTISAG